MDATTCPECGHQNLIDIEDVVEITSDRIDIAKTCEECGAPYALRFALVEKRTETAQTYGTATFVERRQGDWGGRLDP